MGVVRRHQRNLQVALQSVQIAIDLLLCFQPLVLNLQEEIPLAEEVFEFPRHRFGPQISLRSVQILVAQHFAQLAAQAAGESDQPPRMFSQILLAHARPPIKTVQARLRRQPDQILVAFFVLGEHQQMVVLVLSRGSGRRQVHTAGVVPTPGRLGAMIFRLAHVELAAQDRLHALRFGRIKKVHSSVDISVVRHGDGLLPQSRYAIHQLVDIAGAVQQRVLRMQMQVSEFRHGSPQF